jgi:hypothetical protein
VIELKPFIDTGDNIKPAKTIKPYQEMMVDRDDILTLFNYIQIPYNDHACEHQELIECVYRLSKDFDIDLMKYLPDDGIFDEVQAYDNWERCVDSAWHNQ